MQIEMQAAQVMFFHHNQSLKGSMLMVITMVTHLQQVGQMLYLKQQLDSFLEVVGEFLFLAVFSKSLASLLTKKARDRWMKCLEVVTFLSVMLLALQSQYKPVRRPRPPENLSSNTEAAQPVTAEARDLQVINTARKNVSYRKILKSYWFAIPCLH